MYTLTPQQIYYKIGEVGKLADVPTHVLRYWESEFECICPKRTKSGQRLYRPEDVSAVLQIKELLHLQGYTIAGAKKFLDGDEMNGTGSSEHGMGEINSKKYLSHFLALKQEIKGLKELMERRG